MEKIEKFEGHRDRSFYLDIFIPKARLLRDRYVAVKLARKRKGVEIDDAFNEKFAEVEQVYDDVLSCKTPEDFNAVSEHIEQLTAHIMPEIQQMARESFKKAKGGE